MRFKMLNHWHVDNNKLSISLMNYYVDIRVINEKEVLVFKLRVFFDSRERLSFVFDSLEDAITFTEDVINKDNSMTLDDILDTYNKQYNNVKIMKKTEYSN